MSSLVIPNLFVNGVVSDAVAMNQNFAAVVAALNGGLDATNFSTAPIPTSTIAKDHGFQSGHIANAAVTAGKLAPNASVRNRVAGIVVANNLSSNAETVLVQTTAMSWGGGRVLVGGVWSLTWASSSPPQSGTVTIKAYRIRGGVDAFLFQVDHAVSEQVAARFPVPMPMFIDLPPLSGFIAYKLTGITTSPNLFLFSGAHAGVMTAEEAA